MHIQGKIPLHTNGHYFGPNFSVCSKISLALDNFLDVKIIYAVFKALIFATLVIFQMMNNYYTSESRVVSVNAV